ncbi:murein hydrolase activator EnvC family protein [Brumimicrobium salinarum]|uniref:murein hydrolase activator EnvC family protein n=1 Tax=Brumimicrobium salinarum TaxID=2058658 RepID=UPI0013FDA634|nr:peptidoglycan DD-metalloendopeptidase family protein [Brumimicrobium salinarum]
MNKGLVLFFILLCSASFPLWSQTGSQRLKKEQSALEKQIATTKTLLEKSKKNTRLSLDEVHLIEKQVEYRERLLRNIDNQIRSSELKVEQKKGRIQELNAEIERLKKQYAKLLLYAYKKRNKYGDLMFIFSAKSVEEALKRKLYLEKLTEIQKKQMRLIKQNTALLEEEIKSLNQEKKEQEKLAAQKKSERAEIIKTKREKEKVYQRFKEQEEELLKELAQQEKAKTRLKNEIAAAIKREIAAEKARLEKARREAEARRKAEEARKAANTPTVEEAKKEESFSLTAESTLIGESFAANKGKLPWPVEKGTITQNYGKNKHPSLPNVYTQNNGVDISTPKNANVLAIFKGEVTSVINIPGAGKVVIIKHGDYRTVYSNLRDVYVTKGSTVDTKTPIGSLLPNPSGDISVAHFEVHHVKGSGVNQLNPNLWIAK